MLEQPAEPLAGTAPVVVVGAGPVGVRVAQELHRRAPRLQVAVFGAEPWEPYNRVRLSSALAGETDWAALTRDAALPDDFRVRAYFGCPVTAIDREAQYVRDAGGRVQPYSALVLATGSTPHVPDIPGIRLAGVFTFRDMSDAQRLLARRVRSRTTVVLGGGLLGLEAARAMGRFHTEVWVVEHLDRLMARQLDRDGGEVLRRHVERSGIRVVLGDGVVRVLGGERVSGVRLRSGREIACDTLVVATGIVPNVQLALKAGLPVGRGIRVDDRMRTADPRIYAVGECAEHRGRVYGLVAPGLEQAAVAAHTLAGGDARYLGSAAATRLKVLRYPVFSAGRAVSEQIPDLARERIYSRQEQGIYRKLVLERGRLCGAIALGDWSQLARVQEAVARRRRVWPWQLWRFDRAGSLWPDQAAVSVVQWPAAATVCHCTGVTRGQLSAAMAAGCSGAAELCARTGASTVCGACRPLLAELAGGGGPAEPVRGFRPLFAFSAAALVLGLALTLFSVPYPDTARIAWRWDRLWRDTLFKQASGFTLLGLALLLGLLGLRKRWSRLRWLDFAGWRVVHGAIGVAVLVALLFHTGGRMGNQLNLLLAVCLLGPALTGAVAGGVIARGHAFDPPLVRRVREASLWLHLLLLWPLPVLLGFHILKTYYY